MQRGIFSPEWVMEIRKKFTNVCMSEARASQSINLMNFDQNQYSFLSSGARSKALTATQSSLIELQSSDEFVQASTSEDTASAEGKVYSFGVTKQKALNLVDRTRNWLKKEGFEVQEVSGSTDQVVFQIRKNGAWRKVAGMETALRITFAISENKMKLSMKSSKWSTDKSIAMAAGWFVFAPLCATAAYGIYEQHKIPSKIANFIGSQLD